MILETGRLGIGTTVGLTGILAAIGVTADSPATWLHVVASVGLGGVIALFLVRWLVTQHAKAIEKINELTSQMIEMVKTSTEINTKLNDTACILVEASKKRGDEVRLLIAALSGRPCLVMMLSKEMRGQIGRELEEMGSELEKIEKMIKDKQLGEK